ncbi:MAG: pyruvate kinase, partial [Caldilinea sp.]
MNGARRHSQISRLIPSLEKLRADALALVETHADIFYKMEAMENHSARNLLHYLAIRQQDIRKLQSDLISLGLSSLGGLESHALATLNAVDIALHSLAGESAPEFLPEPPVDYVTGPLILRERTQALLGMPSGKRSVRIMVTMPSEAATSYRLVRELLGSGMDVMRINCAHDDPQAWLAMIEHLHRAERKLGRPCKIYADLAGPKLRTGPIEAIGRILKICPTHNLRGEVLQKAQLRFVEDQGEGVTATTTPPTVPLSPSLLQKVQAGDRLAFEDARGRSRSLTLLQKDAAGCFAETDRTCYLETGATVRLLRDEQEIDSGAIGLLPEVSPPILVKQGDWLLLTPDSIPGRNALLDRHGGVVERAQIGCTLPGVFAMAKPDDKIWFDDGKIGGRIVEVQQNQLVISITQTALNGGRLRAEKGINLPDTQLNTPALTEQDLANLALLAPHVDMVGLSFVHRAEDVRLLQAELERLGASHLGIVLKIENRHAFENLPTILLAGLEKPPIGVMVARGDLAVEVGFERLAEV